jgi:hypothetical protein
MELKNLFRKRKVNPFDEFKEIKGILEEIVKEQRLFAKEMRQLQASQDKTDKEINRISKEIDKVNKMVGNLTDGWGKLIEGLVEPSAIRLAKELGIKVKGVLRRVEKILDTRKVEVDIIIEGIKEDRSTLLVVDIKSNYEPSDMKDFLDWYKDFFDFFDNYRTYEVLTAIAAVRFGKGVDIFALKSGFYVMIPEDNIMKINSPKKVKVLVYNP